MRGFDYCKSLQAKVIIEDKNGEMHTIVFTDEYKLDSLKDISSEIMGLPQQEIGVYCSIDIEVYNRNGNLINYAENSFYSGKDSDPEFIVIIEPIELDYVIKIIGTDNGTYTIIARSINNHIIKSEQIKKDIPTSNDEIHEHSIYLKLPNKVDDGDDSLQHRLINPFTLIGIIVTITALVLVGFFVRRNSQKINTDTMNLIATPSIQIDTDSNHSSSSNPNFQSQKHSDYLQQKSNHSYNQPQNQYLSNQFNQPQIIQNNSNDPNVPFVQSSTKEQNYWFCGICGNKQKADYMFCTSCGYKRDN